MILFAISFFLIFTSSYLITSIISPKKSILGFLYLFLIAFAQLVLTFEVLSLFTAIKEFWVLTANVLFLAGSIFAWNKYSRPLWRLDYKDFKHRVNNSLKLDKTLTVLYIGFMIFILTSLFLCLITPITNADAQGYHVARSLFWVLQGSLSHFDTSDIRNLCLPINSEILYAWILLFAKTDVFLGFFSFVGYLLSIVSVYNILRLMGYCTRKKLWVIFILSSLPSVLVQVSGTETDIIIAGLVTTSIFLFWYALKNNKMIPIFMSSLAYALAVGTKTPSIMAIPGVGLFLLALCIHYKKYRPLGLFLGFGIINFLIFSSYNYILNFLQFSNFMGSESFIVVSKNYYGIKGMLANFIKYIFMFFDFTGFKWSDHLNPYIVHSRNIILAYFRLNTVKDGLYTMPYMANRMLLEPLMGAGLLGFLIYLPCTFWALIKPLWSFKSLKTRYLFGFALLFVINIMVLSYSLAYMSFSVRFVMFLIVLSSPVLVYSYWSNRNPLKYIIILFALFYLACVSTHLWPRPLYAIGNILRTTHSISEVRERAHCKDYYKDPQFTNPVCVLRNKIKKDFTNKNRILAFMNTADNIFTLKIMEFQGYKIDFRTMEDADKINFNDYNIMISTNKGQSSTYIKDYEKRKNESKIVNGRVILTKKTLTPCVYVQNNKLITIKGEEDSYPYQVRCGLSSDFLKLHHLKMIGAAGVIMPNLGHYDYYTIYRNTSLPLYRNIKIIK